MFNERLMNDTPLPVSDSIIRKCCERFSMKAVFVPTECNIAIRGEGPLMAIEETVN
jgi:hypothetical protein